MKKVTVGTEVIKVTKKEIKQFLSLERGISYYSGLSQNRLAHACAMAPTLMGWDGSETVGEKIDQIYEGVEGLIADYNKFQQELRDISNLQD